MGKRARDKKKLKKLASLQEASLKKNEEVKKEISDVHDQNKVSSEKKKKIQKGAMETNISETNGQVLKDDKLDTNSVVEEKKKRKKKKNRKAVDSENTSPLESSNNENTSPLESSNNVSEMDESLNGVAPGNEENHETEVKEETVTDSNNPGEEPKKKQKKKKKKQKVEQLESSTADSVQSNTDSVTDTANNEGDNIEMAEISSENKKKKKRKLGKDQNKTLEGGNEPLVKKKKGNQTLENGTCNSVNGTKDKENENSNDKQEDADIGQWSSGAFEDTERQEKFIKLLGAKKPKDKNFSGIQQKLFSIGMSDVDDFKAGAGNPSMNWKQQSDYMETMENDFEKARGMHFKRGRGFGYRKPAFEGKKNFIDVSKNKSIKFDD